MASSLLQKAPYLGAGGHAPLPAADQDCVLSPPCEGWTRDSAEDHLLGGEGGSC